MLQSSHLRSPALRLTFAALLVLCAGARAARAQSGDANFPTPVFSGEVSGRIAPRDVGDPRRTRHFYAFRGTEGDLVVTIETSQLIGDVDVFTGTTFRPLLKFTLFGDPARLSKSFYVRRDESFILRVEARAVGDAEGTYTVRFGGSFAHAPAEMANAAEQPAPALSSPAPRGGTRRVTATGARIEEPRPEPTPAEEARAEPPGAAPAATPAPERPAERRGSTTPRRGRATRNTPRPRPNVTRPEPARPEAAETKPAEDSPAGAGSTTEAAPAPAPSTAPRRRGSSRAPRRGATREGSEARAAEAPPPPPPAPRQRLIIITKDGELLERDMSAVRRVTVENNQVVIVGRDGKVTRRPLADILKMSIEP